MSTNERTTADGDDPPTIELDEIVPGPSRRTPSRGPFRSHPTLWAVAAVLAVVLGGATLIHWVTRTPDVQESSLSGTDVTIPLPDESGSATATSIPETPTATGSATITPTDDTGRKSPGASQDPASATSGTNNGSGGSDGGSGSGNGSGSGSGGGSGAGTGQGSGTGDSGTDDGTTDDGTDDTGGDDTGTGSDDTDSGSGDEAAPEDEPTTSVSVEVSSQVSGQGAGNIMDGDGSTYWEAAKGFPQTVTVDLGSTTTVGRLTLSAPAPTSSSSRAQSLTVLGSTTGDSYSTLKGGSSYRFASGGSATQVSISFSQVSTRYLRLRFTGGSGYSAAQLAELGVYSS
ncbi:discoidin domain-containing protein [Kineosporia sp. J2-2]|uniref:Discoidin domain-containing protein n=1 Tax=Kineosporia corallincola TaxID=2835133 RepID=A0ABS5TD63_9ACTN|nr:discoidin domain-containing protein [Kineosporia corallincola]MBT0769025.1 discoidin domain-containing protein [Kineosporia corallincola]